MKANIPSGVLPVRYMKTDAIARQAITQIKCDATAKSKTCFAREDMGMA